MIKFLRTVKFLIIVAVPLVAQGIADDISDSYSRLFEQSEMIKRYLENYEYKNGSYHIITQDTSKVNDDLRTLAYNAHMIDGLVERENIDFLSWGLLLILFVMVIGIFIERKIEELLANKTSNE